MQDKHDKGEDTQWNVHNIVNQSKNFDAFMGFKNVFTRYQLKHMIIIIGAWRTVENHIFVSIYGACL